MNSLGTAGKLLLVSFLLVLLAACAQPRGAGEAPDGISGSQQLRKDVEADDTEPCGPEDGMAATQGLRKNVEDEDGESCLDEEEHAGAASTGGVGGAGTRRVDEAD